MPVQPVQNSQSVPGYSMFSVDQATTGTSLGPSGRFVVPSALTRSANWERRQAEPRHGLNDSRARRNSIAPSSIDRSWLGVLQIRGVEQIAHSVFQQAS